jgi:hypothetical protein
MRASSRDGSSRRSRTRARPTSSPCSPTGARVHAAFRAAYRDAVAGSGVWPRDDEEADRLLNLAKIERLLYGIRYELTHRPELVTVPLRDLIAGDV